jgi:hypothetical protein
VTAELLEAAKASLPVRFVEDGPPLVSQLRRAYKCMHACSQNCIVEAAAVATLSRMGHW